MHKEILSQRQVEIIPNLSKYKKDFILVGGTAIAFHIGHRSSIYFDLFSFKRFSNLALKRDIATSNFDNQVILELSDQIHFNFNQVKLTFFEFPFKLKAEYEFENSFRLPDLLTLAAMKAFALGGRGKWKDYVDLYFILKSHYSIIEVSEKAKELFASSFNPMLFKKQICFFDDINYSETVDYLPGFETDEDTIKAYLIDVAMS